MFRKVSCAELVWIGMLGESSRLSLTTWGLSMKAAFGAESKGGGGKPELEVVHSGAGPWAFVAVQPAGSWGGVTPSKAWLNVVAGSAQEAAAASKTSALAVAAEPVSPPAARSVVPIAVPATSERARLRLGAVAQLLVAGS